MNEVVEAAPGTMTEAWSLPRLAGWFSPGRSISKLAGMVFLAGVAVKLTALLKEMVLARCFGRSAELEAYLIALLIPALLVNLVAESMCQAFLPTLIRVRLHASRAAADHLQASVILILVCMLLTATVLLALLAPVLLPFFAAQFSPSQLTLARHLLYLLLPYTLLAGMCTLGAALLSSVDRYLWPALAPILVSSTVMAAAMLYWQRFGIGSVAVALLMGTCLQLAILFYESERTMHPFRIGWHGMDAPLHEVMRRFVSAFFSCLLASAGLLIDQCMAASLKPGSLAGLAYANRYVSVVLALSAGALSTTLTPHFSRMVAADDLAQCKASLHRLLRQAAWMTVPLTLLLMLFSQSLVHWSLERGMFTSSDTAAVAPILCLYAIQIPFFVCSRVDYRFLLSRGRTDLIFYCGLVNLFLDIAFNLILMRSMGVAGIALSTSLWTISTFILLRYWSWKQFSNKVRQVVV